MAKVVVLPKKDDFQEGDFVISNDSGEVYLVTVPAKGYDECQEGTFWAISLTGNRCSGGNYLKSNFVPFRGVINIEV